jgi:hypothetical protein
MRAIEKEFVDLNELRVATDLEIQELLGVRYPDDRAPRRDDHASLNNIFEREHTLSLDRLKTISKRDARQFLRELPDIHPFVEAYVMLFGFDGHAFPADDRSWTLRTRRRRGRDQRRRSPAIRRAPPQSRRVLRTSTPPDARPLPTGTGRGRRKSDFRMQEC